MERWVWKELDGVSLMPKITLVQVPGEYPQVLVTVSNNEKIQATGKTVETPQKAVELFEQWVYSKTSTTRLNRGFCQKSIEINHGRSVTYCMLTMGHEWKCLIEQPKEQVQINKPGCDKTKNCGLPSGHNCSCSPKKVQP
jgi:hypothetical protein